MNITFTVSPDQAKKLIDYHEKLQDQAMEEVKICVDGKDNGLQVTKELMGDALTDEEREMFDSIPF